MDTKHDVDRWMERSGDGSGGWSWVSTSGGQISFAGTRCGGSWR